MHAREILFMKNGVGDTSGALVRGVPLGVSVSEGWPLGLIQASPKSTNFTMYFPDTFLY